MPFVYVKLNKQFKDTILGKKFILKFCEKINLSVCAS